MAASRGSADGGAFIETVRDVLAYHFRIQSHSPVCFCSFGTLAGCPVVNPVGRGLGFMGGTKTPLNRHNCGSSYLTPELTGLAGTLQGYGSVSMAMP